VVGEFVPASVGVVALRDCRDVGDLSLPVCESGKADSRGVAVRRCPAVTVKYIVSQLVK
jgi:hypothetical protein